MASQTSHHHNKINIAIDGPAGAGKSTVARMVSQVLSYVYVDTGAMYRAVTWYMIEQGIQPGNEQQVLQTVQNMVIELIPGKDEQKVLLNDQDVTGLIRSQAVNDKVSQFAQIEGLREWLVRLQRQMTLRKGVVMDGRDIGTTVLPDAELKIFMTATVEERARRRFLEIKDSTNLTLEQLQQQISNRDRLDQEREISPLRQAEDAILLDTTNMSTSEVVDVIVLLSKDSKVGREDEHDL